MELLDKLSVLADAAKYDAACTSSGAKRGFQSGKIGCTSSGVMGCCHSFSADGRCITLLKVLMSNACVYDCKYCVNRRSNDTRRAAFTPQELAEQSDTRAAVRRGLDRLSPEHRQVLLLRYMQELDYGEIAQVLDVSEGTVKSRINRAKSKLRELLGGGNFFAGTAVLPTEERERRERP